MPSGYRSIIALALAGLVLVSLGVGAYLTALTYPEQERYQSYNDARTNQDGAAATAANLSNTPQNRTPCVNPKSETESDLCAQWRAARAAEKAADWTLWGVIASIIGIACLLWQIILTRKAVEDTGHATTAMVEANKIAKNAKRPWITFDVAPVQFTHLMGTNRCAFTFDVKFRNVGGSVATAFNFQSDITFGGFGKTVPTDAAWLNTEPHVADSKVAIMPGDSDVRSFKVEKTNDDVWFVMDDKLAQFMQPFILISVFYKSQESEAEWHRTLRCYQFDKKGSLIRRDETLLHANDLGLTPFSGFIAT